MKFLTVLLSVVLISVVSATIISLEEGDADTKRVHKWILDPASPSFPRPRFPLQNGKDNDWKEFRFLGTLDCSMVPSDEVAMAIYLPEIDDWECISTGMLPNDTSGGGNVTTGVPSFCPDDLVAVWNDSAAVWQCNTRRALLYQAEGLIQATCRSQDILVINTETSGDYGAKPAGLCVASSEREVGTDANTGLRRRHVSKNIGDPDESFYVQSTSKAIGGLAANHYDWQYWLWSPLKTSLASALGSFPPIIPFDGMHLAAVISSTYTWTNGGGYVPANIAIGFRVVRIRATGTVSGSTWSNIRYTPNDFTTTITAPDITVYTDVAVTPLPDTALTQRDALSIRIISFPSVTGSPKSSWLTVSLWISQIVAEV